MRLYSIIKLLFSSIFIQSLASNQHLYVLSFFSVFNIDISSLNSISPIVFNYISNYKVKNKKTSNGFIINFIITFIFKSYSANYSYLVITITTTYRKIIKSFDEPRHLFTVYDVEVAFKYTQLVKVQPVRSFLKWPYIFENLLLKRKSCQTGS